MNINDLSDEELVELEKHVIQDKCKNDLYYLAKHALQHKDMTRYTHSELCQLIQDWRKKHGLFLLPRGTFKSSIITEAFVIQELLKDPNKTILVYCETYTKAKEYVRQIREHFEKHIFPIFGNIKDDSFWREDGFRVAGRTILSREPSVTPGGIDKPATGLHFDIIICDDLVGETNSNTTEQLAKAKKRLGELESVLNPGGTLYLVGTIWDESDIYCDIIKAEGYDTNNWDELLENKILLGRDYNVYIRTAKDKETLFFPERLDEKELEKISRLQEDAHHKKQYYNDPRSMSNQVFKSEWREKAMQLWHDAEKDNNGKPKVYETYMLVDPAISTTTSADYTGIIVLGRDYSDVWYILEAMQLKLDTEELLETIITIRGQYRPRFVSMESKGFSKVLVQWLIKKRKEKGIYFKVMEYDPGNKDSKEKRINSLVPRFKAGTIAYCESMVELDQQLRKHPTKSSKDHDDLIDALAQATQMINKPIVLPCAKEDKDSKIKLLF